MKLTEAIKTLKEWDILPANEVDQDLRDAVALGIEALKRFKEYREGKAPYGVWVLPSETEN